MRATMLKEIGKWVGFMSELILPERCLDKENIKRLKIMQSTSLKCFFLIFDKKSQKKWFEWSVNFKNCYTVD